MKVIINRYINEKIKIVNISSLTKLLNYVIRVAELFNFDIYKYNTIYLINFNEAGILHGSLSIKIPYNTAMKDQISFYWNTKTNECKITIFRNKARAKAIIFNINDIIV